MRLGQKIWNDMYKHIQTEMFVQEGKEKISISCPYLFYMTDDEFIQKYIKEENDGEI